MAVTTAAQPTEFNPDTNQLAALRELTLTMNSSSRRGGWKADGMRR
jgi:hypothetical protein